MRAAALAARDTASTYCSRKKRRPDRDPGKLPPITQMSTRPKAFKDGNPKGKSLREPYSSLVFQRTRRPREGSGWRARRDSTPEKDGILLPTGCVGKRECNAGESQSPALEPSLPGPPHPGGRSNAVLIFSFSVSFLAAPPAHLPLPPTSGHLEGEVCFSHHAPFITPPSSHRIVLCCVVLCCVAVCFSLCVCVSAVFHLSVCVFQCFVLFLSFPNFTISQFHIFTELS